MAFSALGHRSMSCTILSLDRENCEPASIERMEDESYPQDHRNDRQGWQHNQPRVYRDDLAVEIRSHRHEL